MSQHICTCISVHRNLPFISFQEDQTEPPSPAQMSPPLPPRLSRPLPPRLNRPLPTSRWVLGVNLHESLYVVCVCRQIKSAPCRYRKSMYRVQMSQIFTCISLILLYYTHSGKRPEAATLKEAEAGKGEGRHSWCGQLHCEEWAPGPCQRVAATPEAEWWRQRGAAKSAGLTDNLINTAQLLLKKASPHVSVYKMSHVDWCCLLMSSLVNSFKSWTTKEVTGSRCPPLAALIRQFLYTATSIALPEHVSKTKSHHSSTLSSLPSNSILWIVKSNWEVVIAGCLPSPTLWL